MAGSGINKVIIVGNLGDDPEVSYTQAGVCVAKISVATSDRWKDKQSGEQQERTEWHRITMFSRLGEVAGEYLKKGSQVYIEGSLKTDKYQDKKTSDDRYSTSIIAREMKLLGAKPGGSGRSRTAQSTPSQQTQTHADFDDDIPF